MVNLTLSSTQTGVFSAVAFLTEGCTGPGGTAFPGRCIEWTEKAHFPFLSSNNRFQYMVPR